MEKNPWKQQLVGADYDADELAAFAVMAILWELEQIRKLLQPEIEQIEEPNDDPA